MSANAETGVTEEIGIPPTDGSPLDTPPAEGDAPASTPTGEGDANVDPVKAEMDELWQARMAKMQGSKDSEIAALNKRIDDLTSQPAPPAEDPSLTSTEAAQQAGLDGNKFIDLINSDPNAAMQYLQSGMASPQPNIDIAAEVQRQVQEQTETTNARQQYESDFARATQGYTQNEVDMAVHAVKQGQERGVLISAQEAAAIGRFGSMDNALKYATELATERGAVFGGDATPVVPDTPIGDPLATAPVVPTHPPVPGGDAGSVPNPNPPQGGSSQDDQLQGMYKKLF